MVNILIEAFTHIGQDNRNFNQFLSSLFREEIKILRYSLTAASRQTYVIK